MPYLQGPKSVANIILTDATKCVGCRRAINRAHDLLQSVPPEITNYVVTAVGKCVLA